MEELTEVITAAECHPHQCNVFVYSSSKGTIRLCDTRAAALCDRHSKCEYFKSSQSLFFFFSSCLFFPLFFSLLYSSIPLFSIRRRVWTLYVGMFPDAVSFSPKTDQTLTKSLWKFLVLSVFAVHCLMSAGPCVM